jgi:hypothetical protein
MNERADWVAAGRACHRFGFAAPALGLKYAFINQPVEVADLRAQFASYLGLGGRRPDMVRGLVGGQNCRNRSGARRTR